MVSVTWLFSTRNSYLFSNSMGDANVCTFKVRSFTLLNCSLLKHETTITDFSSAKILNHVSLQLLNNFNLINRPISILECKHTVVNLKTSKVSFIITPEMVMQLLNLRVWSLKILIQILGRSIITWVTSDFDLKHSKPFSM